MNRSIAILAAVRRGTGLRSKLRLLVLPPPRAGRRELWNECGVRNGECGVRDDWHGGVRDPVRRLVHCKTRHVRRYCRMGLEPGQSTELVGCAPGRYL